MSEATTWKIRVSGYGTFEFEGTEAQAEAMRAHKAEWEHGTGLKWRSDLSTPVDECTARIAELLDERKGVPVELLRERRQLMEAAQLSKDI